MKKYSCFSHTTSIENIHHILEAYFQSFGIFNYGKSILLLHILLNSQTLYYTKNDSVNVDCLILSKISLPIETKCEKIIHALIPK